MDSQQTFYYDAATAVRYDAAVPYALTPTLDQVRAASRPRPLSLRERGRG